MAAGRPWTEGEIRALRALPRTVKLRDFAARIGRTVDAVCSKAARLGILRQGRRRSARRWTAAEDRAVRASPHRTTIALPGRTCSAVRARRCILRKRDRGHEEGQAASD